jgi:hypothetical protein
MCARCLQISVANADLETVEALIKPGVTQRNANDNDIDNEEEGPIRYTLHSLCRGVAHRFI